ncbi:hypothetical protein V8F20_011666 [Naviculisporaceae sp. PSN 640]
MATTTITRTETYTEKSAPVLNRPRRSSKSKHLNLWRDIDSPPTAYYNYSSPPSYLDILLRKYTPAFIQTRLDRISPQTYDLIIATFFSALAIVVLSILFIGPQVEFITSIMGTYAVGFGLCVGTWEVMGLVNEGNGLSTGEGNQSRPEIGRAAI